ncbi:MAG: Fur family transcriptional regulator [Fastidiosipilaceae bacterium]|nr:transcriptional repressor [Clostridiaceae bacterium]
MLKDNDLAVSNQRIEILQYLVDHRDHPTCEMIYRKLKESGNLSLSRATVYNNVKTFVEAGLLQELELGDHERRYDVDTKDHCHFYCQECGNIFNLNMSNELEQALQTHLNNELSGSHLKKKTINYLGICPNCSPSQTD